MRIAIAAPDHHRVAHIIREPHLPSSRRDLKRLLTIGGSVKARIWNARTGVATISTMALLLVALANPAHAITVGYYEMCFGEGQPAEANAITNAGHTAVKLSDLTPAELAPVDVIMVNNCENTFYAQEYLDRMNDVADAVAAGKILVLHDRFVELAETILPGGSTFDIQRYPNFPDPNNEAKDINVLDASTMITNGPAGTITDATLDNGNFSNHGFAVAGTLPGAAKLVLSTNDPTHIVTFLYTYGAGAVLYSSIPLDHYLGGSNAFSNVYALNVVDYTAYLLTACGDGVTDPGEDCDLGGANGAAGTCCTAGCGFVSSGTECRASAGACDLADSCSGASGLCPTDERAPAGTSCRAAASDCDVEETCDGSSVDCPTDALEPAGTTCTDDGDLCTDDECNGAGTCSHLAKADADLDGTCDEQDVCNNPFGAQNFVGSKPTPNLTFTKINNDVTPGNDGLKIGGEFTLAVGQSFATLSPLTTGARIVVDSGSGTTRVDAVLPGGAYGGSGTRGWRTNAKGNQWTYTDASASPISGIKKVKINDRSKTGPRRVRVSIGGAKATYPVVAADAPLQAIVVLGNQTSAIAGACGETNFGTGSCKLNGRGTTLTCR
jgi:hypothetical protein